MLLDVVPISNNPYDRSFSDTVAAQTVGLGIKNGVIGKWIATGIYNSPIGETGGIWKLLSDQSKWLSPSFATYGDIANASGVAKNGLLYNTCNSNTYTTSTATSFCSSIGMRMPSYTEAAGWSSAGVPSCSYGYTRTSTVDVVSAYGPYYKIWSNGSIYNSWIDGLIDEQVFYYARCVK